MSRPPEECRTNGSIRKMLGEKKRKTPRFWPRRMFERRGAIARCTNGDSLKIPTSERRSRVVTFVCDRFCGLASKMRRLLPERRWHFDTHLFCPSFDQRALGSKRRGVVFSAHLNDASCAQVHFEGDRAMKTVLRSHTQRPNRRAKVHAIVHVTHDAVTHSSSLFGEFSTRA